MKRTIRGKRLSAFCLAVLFASVLVSPVWADGNPGDKMIRGFKNALSGWLEIPDGVKDASEATNPFTALTYGLSQGAGAAVERTAVGAHDMGTFLIPDYDKPVLPEENVF